MKMENMGVLLWCSDTFSSTDMFNSLRDDITLDLFGSASYITRVTWDFIKEKHHNIAAFH